MFEKLKEYLNNSYSPYSNFKVAALVVTRDGKGFFGVNVENKSYGGSVCAERNAINSAISEGYTDFKEIHILASEDYTMPCFICRQTFTEFFDNNVKIYIYDNSGNKKEYELEEICPLLFEANL